MSPDPDEDSNLAPSPLPDLDSDSMLGGPVDEEEKWLDALEKGELDDNGELKKEIDVSLLTARQVRTEKRPVSVWAPETVIYRLNQVYFEV